MYGMEGCMYKSKSNLYALSSGGIKNVNLDKGREKVKFKQSPYLIIGNWIISLFIHR